MEDYGKYLGLSQCQFQKYMLNLNIILIVNLCNNMTSYI